MDVSNGTGSSTDYKVIGSGGTRGPGGWNPLPGHSRTRHAVDDDGPWEIKFKVANGAGAPHIVGARFNDPDAEVVLVEHGGEFGVDIKTRHH